MKKIFDRISVPALAGLVLVVTVLVALMAIGHVPAAVAAPEESPVLSQDEGPLYTTYTTMTVTTIRRSGGGVTDTLTAAINGQKFSNNGKVFVEVDNAYTGTITATFVLPGTVDGQAIPDLAIPVGAGVTKFVGPFPPAFYNQPSGADQGKVYIEWSSVTSVTVGAFTLD